MPAGGTSCTGASGQGWGETGLVLAGSGFPPGRKLLSDEAHDVDSASHTRSPITQRTPRVGRAMRPPVSRRRFWKSDRSVDRRRPGFNVSQWRWPALSGSTAKMRSMDGHRSAKSYRRGPAWPAKPWPARSGRPPGPLTPSCAISVAGSMAGRLINNTGLLVHHR